MTDGMTEAEPNERLALAVVVRREGAAGERPRLVTAIRDVLTGVGAWEIDEMKTDDRWELLWLAPPPEVVRAAEAVRQNFGWHAAVGIGVARTPLRARRRARLASHASGRVPVSGAGTVDLQTGVQIAAAIIGAVAGLAVWIAVVGGVTMWARLHRADVPETQGVAVLPREVLVGVGVHVLAVMLIFAVPLAAIAAALSSTHLQAAAARAKDVGQEAKARAAGVLTVRILIGVLPAAVVAVYAFSAWFDVKLWALGLIAVVCVATLASLFAAFSKFGDGRRVARALTVFAIVLAAGVAAGALREFGSRSLRLDRAEVMLDGDSRSWDGMYIARTGDTLYVARIKGKHGCWIEVIPISTVRVLRIREYRRDESGCKSADKSAVSPGSGTTTVANTEPARTVTVTSGTVTIAPDTVTLPPERVTVPAETITVTETRETERPAGARLLDDGRWIIPVESVQPPLRLAISAPRYSRSPLRDTSPLRVTFRISAVRGYVVEGARVYVRALRAKYFEHAETTSDSRGFAHLCLRPTTEVPFGPSVRLALFVRVWNPHEPLLAGSSQRRLVQLHLGPRVTEAGPGDC